MFKIGKKKENGFFFVYGKHSCYGDFINIGTSNPIASAFAKWVENGINGTGFEKRPRKKMKFWAEGPNNELICGFIGDSYDSYQRKYPLITAWAGSPPLWKKNWSIIPAVCKECWSSFETIFDNNKLDYKKFQKNINDVNKPLTNWEELLKSKGKGLTLNLKRTRQNLHKMFYDRLNNIDGLLREEIFSIPVGSIDDNDLLTVSWKFNELYNKRAKNPNAVFIGGSKSEKHIIFVNRQLSINDLKYIWTL
ncbi:MAG: DUF2094 domain-containing protein [Desulfobacterales bacterium]|nr:DUF2094 domain-containing protein [Desulfobacterales bacterium]